MPPQPWLEQLSPVDRRAFAILKGRATDEQRAVIRQYIERPVSAQQQVANARFVAALVNGANVLAKEPCPLPALATGIQRWTLRQEELNWFNTQYVTCITYVEEACDELEAQELPAVMQRAAQDPGFQCASLRNHDPRSAVWVRTLGMIDPADRRHPCHGTAESAVLGRDGMYHLPRPAEKSLDVPPTNS